MLGAAASGFVLIAAACGAPTGSPSGTPGSTASASASSSPRPAAASASDALDTLAAAADAEGRLTTIALPHDWCDYGEAISRFSQKYGIEVSELNPNATFADQIAAIKPGASGSGSPAGSSGSSPAAGGSAAPAGGSAVPAGGSAVPDGESAAPDVIDVDPLFAAQAKSGKLIQPYKVSTWDDIPATAKDPNGFWYGGYYGVLTFETNAERVTTPPKDWADLLDASHAGQVALAGDPRVTSQAIESVYAAALANGGSLDNAQPGLDFFKALKAHGNLLPTIASPTAIDAGTTPVTIRWSYNSLAHRDTTNGTPQIDVEVPATGRLGGIYAQAIAANAAHPNAAKLWMEFLYSDEGQNILLKGYCLPIRLEAMARSNMVPADLAAKAPDTSGTVFPSLAQLQKATELITKNWDRVVALDIH
jgi:putative spermidine/putrescine transport system substrate-binding protein